MKKYILKSTREALKACQLVNFLPFVPASFLSRMMRATAIARSSVVSFMVLSCG